MMNRILYKAALVCCLWVLPSSLGAQSGVDEYYAKAGFIYNFTKFVEWPGASKVSNLKSINVCIQGKDPFGQNLDLIRKSSNAKLTLNVVTDVQDSQIRSCHLLFISTSEKPRLSSILGIIKGYPVLTVSEIEGFSKNGGIIEFTRIEKNIGVFSKNKIGFKISDAAARAVGLSIDPQLLELAQSMK